MENTYISIAKVENIEQTTTTHPSIAPSCVPSGNLKVLNTEHIITLFGEQLEVLDGDGDNVNTFGASIKDFLMELLIKANPTVLINQHYYSVAVIAKPK